MTVRSGAILVQVLVVIALCGYLTGCQEPVGPQQATTPGGEQQAAGHEGHNHEAGESDQAHGEHQQTAEKPTVEQAKAQLKDQNLESAVEAISQLATFLKDPNVAAEAEQVLRDTAQKDPNPSLRSAAVQVLAQDAKKFMDVLIAASKDKERQVQETAIGSLGSCPPRSAAEARLKEIAKDPDPTLRSLASAALTAMYAGGGAGEIVALVAQLGNPDNDAASQAAIALKKTKGAEALPYLDRVLRTSTNPRQRHGAAMCVAMICAGYNPAQQRFASSTHSVRKEKRTEVRANPAGVPILTRAINDPEPMVREIAAQGLGYLGDARAAVPLAKALKDPDVHVRRRAAAALITVPAKAVQAQLVEAALHDRDASVRRFAVEALGWIGDSSVTPALAQAAMDPSDEVRRYAAVQLGRLGDPASLDALIKLFKDPNEDVRWMAVQAVAGMKDRRAVRHLVQALDDPCAQVSHAAETGLQRLGIGRQKVAGLDY